MLQSAVWMFLNYFLLNIRIFFFIVFSTVKVLLSAVMILNSVSSECCKMLRQKLSQRN